MRATCRRSHTARLVELIGSPELESTLADHTKEYALQKVLLFLMSWWIYELDKSSS
ncbi:MAG: hypothetical protein WCF65_01450 [Parachlamydiaceae bacterium]